MYVLDTNVISELRKVGNGACHPHVFAWSNSVSARTLYLSVITIMELEIGRRSLARHDTVQAALLKAWIDGYVLKVFNDRIIAIDQAVALRCAELHVPDRKSERDALIAGTALYRDFTVVTRNIRDFDKTGVKLLNPWTFSTD